MKSKLSQPESRAAAPGPDNHNDMIGLPRCETDVLVKVVDKLKEARFAAQAATEKAILYFIDMAMFQVLDALSSVPESDGLDVPEQIDAGIQTREKRVTGACKVG